MKVSVNGWEVNEFTPSLIQSAINQVETRIGILNALRGYKNDRLGSGLTASQLLDLDRHKSNLDQLKKEQALINKYLKA